MSQAASILPGSPLTGATAAADINASMAAIISKFSGASAPPLGPGISQALVVGQDWLDTSVAPNVWRKWDGAQWCPLANLDPTLHTAGIVLPWRNIMGTNGGFEVWQRGAGNSSSIAVGASSTVYTADRWYLTTGANQASTVSAAASLSAQGSVACKVARNSGQTGAAATLLFGYPFDSDEIVLARGQLVTASFLAKAGANWSASAGSLNLSLFCGTGAPAKRSAGAYTGESTPISTTITILPSQTLRVVVTASAIIPTNTTQMEIQPNWNPTGTAGADDSITFDNFQLEVGGMASPFEQAPLDLQLLRCKRHFWKSFAYGTAPAQNVGVNTGEVQAISGVVNPHSGFVTMRNPMRAAPAVTTYNPAAANAQMRDETANVDCSGTGSFNTTTETFNVSAVVNASTAVGNVLGMHMIADAGI